MPTTSRTPIRARLTAGGDPVLAFGIIPASGLETGAKVAGVDTIAVRQLAVLLEGTTLGSTAEMVQRVARYRKVIEQAFLDRTVVPLPCDTVFRSRASVARWLELHHSPLQEALDFVADRATMRVRVSVPGSPATEAAAVSLEAHLWTALRGLKGDAVAAIPVATQADGAVGTDRSAACAYLIERESVPAFEERVAHLTSAQSHLRVELTGPLPPYDFVKMDFGG